MTRLFTTVLISTVALGAAAMTIGPASAMPVSGATLDMAAPAPMAVEQVRFFYHRGFHRGYGFRHGYGYGYRRFGYRRGLPGHPIRHILHAL